MNVLSEAALMNLTEVEAVLDEMSRLESKRKKLGAKIKECEKRVVEYMDANQLTLFATENYQASLTRSVSKRFDTTQFKAEHARMYNKYVRDVETTRFSYHIVSKKA